MNIQLIYLYTVGCLYLFIAIDPSFTNIEVTDVVSNYYACVYIGTIPYD